MSRSTYSGFCFPSFESFDLTPDSIEIQREPVTAGNFDRALRSPEKVLVTALKAPPQDFQASELRIDDPVVAHSEGGVVGHLLHSIPATVAGCGGDDLDGDVGRLGDDAVGGRQGSAREVDGDRDGGLSSALRRAWRRIRRRNHLLGRTSRGGECPARSPEFHGRSSAPLPPPDGRPPTLPARLPARRTTRRERAHHGPPHPKGSADS
jgi:hypothetical protein